MSMPPRVISRASTGIDRHAWLAVSAWLCMIGLLTLLLSTNPLAGVLVAGIAFGTFVVSVVGMRRSA